MAKTTLRRRLGGIGILSVLAIVLLGFWLLNRSGERTLSSLSIASGSRPKVKLRQGTYVGFEVKGDFPVMLEEFLGIPYGQSTDGERRFRPPLPVNASKDTFDAQNYGHRCPAGPPDGIPMSEDCLNLNIYRPKNRPRGKNLPVLVHFFGGSHNFGSGKTRQISNMVGWSTEPFIGLSFNHRVGALGFLASSLMTKEGLLNIGLKDQALLLEWVQENIAEFGGDPNDVTLMGVSAGAHSVR
jgi:carboxylesterase type B